MKMSVLFPFILNFHYSLVSDNPHSGYDFISLKDWLLSRSIVNSDWKSHLEAIQQNAQYICQEILSGSTRANEDLSTSENMVSLTSFMEGRGPFLFYDLEDLLCFLLEHKFEDGSRNLLGHYQSKVLKNLNQYINQYKKKNLHLCESALFLVRYVKYEIPNIEKLIHSYEKGILDGERKKNEYYSQIESYEKGIEQDCKSYGIEGVHVREELVELTKSIVPILNQVEEKCKSTIIADAVNFFDDFASRVHGQSNIPWTGLNQVIHGVESLRIEKAPSKTVVDSSGLEIEIVSSGYENLPGHPLEDASLRHLLLNDLYMLFHFFNQRIVELKMTQSQSIPILFYDAIIKQSSSEEQLNMYRDAISEIIGLLTSKHLETLWEIRSSELYIERICKGFASKNSHIAQLKQYIKDIDVRRRELEQKIVQSKTNVSKWTLRTQDIKKRVEKTLSQMYHGRPVHIQ